MTIAQELARLKTHTTEQLVARHVELTGEPPPTRYKAGLFRRVAWLVQAERFGGLDDATQARLDAAIDALDLDLTRTPETPRKRPTRTDDIAVGTVLTRVYKGQTFRVTATDEGFEYQGLAYPSLSAVARTITGSKWNGKLFFGLTKRSRDR